MSVHWGLVTISKLTMWHGTVASSWNFNMEMFLGHLRCLIGDINNHCQNIDADAAELELKLQFSQFSLLNAVERVFYIKA